MSTDDRIATLEKQVSQLQADCRLLMYQSGAMQTCNAALIAVLEQMPDREGLLPGVLARINEVAGTALHTQPEEYVEGVLTGQTLITSIFSLEQPSNAEGMDDAEWQGFLCAVAAEAFMHGKFADEYRAIQSQKVGQ